MESPKTRTLPPPNRVRPEELEEALLHWDELDELSLVTLAAHPEAGRRLAGLRAAERWLRQGAPSSPPTAFVANGESETPGLLADCPAPDELFDLGRGPGCQALEPARERELRAHLADCPECAVLVATLATPPPLPIEDAGSGLSPGPQEDRAPREPARRLPRSRTWVPFLLAASLASVAFLPQFLGSGAPGLGDLPAAPLLRGELSNELLFPRDRVLALPGAASNSTTSARPSFELSPVPGARGYKVELFEQDGGALAAGSLKQVLRSVDPVLAGSDPLLPGHYTWHAWALVDGLERPLGALDFEVVEDAPLAAELQRSLSDPAPTVGELVELISELHEAGLCGDARALARRLPESPEREQYLLPPGR